MYKHKNIKIILFSKIKISMQQKYYTNKFNFVRNLSKL